MNLTLTAGALLIGLTIGTTSGLHATTQPQTSRRSSSGSETASPSVRAPYQRQQTWYEFMLKQFNPEDVDYGLRIERQRRALIDARIKNPYLLYGLCTSIAFLFAIAVCTKQWIDHRRSMWITAEMMADISNQDAYSRRIAQEAIGRYNTHIERCNRAIEAAEQGGAISSTGSEIEQLRSELTCVASERDTATRERDLAREELRKKSEIMAELSIRLEALTNKSGASGSAKSSSDLRGADAKLVTHINNLQEQLYAERNNNRRLRGG
jgi:hypothetical protein